MFLPRNGTVGFTGDRALASKGDDGFTQLPATPVGDSTSRVTQKSHIISLGHFLRTSQNVAIPTILIHSLKYPQGNYVRNCWDQATHPHSQRRQCGGRRRDLPRCRWAAAGPGRASRRRAERSSQRGRLAGGPPPTGTHSGRALRRPEHQRYHKQPGPAGSRVRQRGGYRSTRPLSAHSATASSRLRPNERQSWRRRRIHRNMPPTTAAPRPAPPIRPSKPVRARPFFGLVAGTSGAT